MKYLLQYRVAILSFVLIFIILVIALRNISESSKVNEKQSLEQAIHRGIMECYALEGRYPESLQYLIEEYQIVYNQDRYDIEYEVIASNILPTVTIISKE